jgi:cell wall-associated NlpC family hydrolase
MSRKVVGAWIVCSMIALGLLIVPAISQASTATALAKAVPRTSATTNVARKERLLILARQWDLAIPAGLNPLSPIFGVSASALLKEAQAYIGIPVTGTWTTETQYAIYPPTVAAAALIYCHDERTSHDMHFSETRPMVLVRLPGVPPVCDCSWFATQCFWDAQRPDPNGEGYDGAGDTQTLLAHGVPLAKNAAQAGDLVFYGVWGSKANPAHVAVCIGKNEVVSMGREGDPSIRAIGYRTVVAVRRYP